MFDHCSIGELDALQFCIKNRFKRYPFISDSLAVGHPSMGFRFGWRPKAKLQNFVRTCRQANQSAGQSPSFLLGSFFWIDQLIGSQPIHRRWRQVTEMSASVFIRSGSQISGAFHFWWRWWKDFLKNLNGDPKLNHPFLGDQTMQMYCNFVAFPW